MTGGGAGRLVVGLDGPRPTAAERAWLRRWRPAGVILFPRNVTGPAQLRELCAELRELLPPDAEIMADHEGGPVSVLAAAAGRPPAPWALGRLDDPALTRAVHRDTARAAGALGVGRLLAPCADVLVQPLNPVIGARSFGPDVDRVVRHVAAAVAGLREGGVRATLKHWPGHGGTAADSHDGPAPVGEGACAEPFAAGLEAGADAVMLGHLAVTRGGPPATLDPESAAAVRRLPGGPMALADDITMGALRPALEARGVVAPGEGLADPGALPRAWLDAVAAGGCDRLLCRGIPWRALPADPDGEDAAAPVSPTPGAPAADPESWGEARRRAIGDLRPPAAPVLWLDATAGDRWGGLGDGDWIAAGLPRPVLRLDAAAPAPPASGASFASVVITSHRPLAALGVSRVAALADLCRGALPPSGRAVVLGHPALAGECGALLPPGWRLEALYAADPAGLADLAAARPGPGVETG